MGRGLFRILVTFCWLVSLCSLVVVSGCAKKAQKTASLPVEQVGGEKGAGAGVGEGELASSLQTAGEISEGRTNAPMLPVYFDFDKFNVRPDMKSRMQDDAKFLLDNPQVKIVVQGNCDERGTAEYNLALGERRAKSAKAYLINLGVAADRIDTVSFGKERPLDEGHNDAAWAKNRRDDFVIAK